MSAAAPVRVNVAGKMRTAQDGESAAGEPTQATDAPAPLPTSTYGELQRLVDRAANFHVCAVAGGTATGVGGGIGIHIAQPLHPMAIEPHWPAGGSMQAAQAVGPASGRLEASLRWIPDDFVARPDREPPETSARPGAAQRFVLQGGDLWVNPQSGFRLFGAGRVFPAPGGDPGRLMAGAVCDFVEGFGAFRGLQGNCTLNGDLTREGFQGNIMIRVRDPQGRLVTSDALPALDAIADPEPGISYLTWLGQKTPEPRLANAPSFTEANQIRGLNIPVDLKLLSTGWAITSGSFRAKAFNPGGVIGLEIGFGREAVPRSPLTGNAMAPFQFEGVSKYTFKDRGGATVGTVTANVVEGRSMMVNLEGAPGQPALRFGFFGPVITGTGCFAGARGMLCGASGSVFNPPPLDHVISNWYVLRLYDAEGKFRRMRSVSQ